MKDETSNVLDASFQQLDKLSTDILRGQLMLEGMASSLSELDENEKITRFSECGDLIARARDCYSKAGAAIWSLREWLEDLATDE